MPWGFPSASSSSGRKDDQEGAKTEPRKPGLLQQMTGTDKSRPSPPPPPNTNDNDGKFWSDGIARSIQDHLSVPRNWIAPAAAAGLTLGLWTFYQSYLRRIPGPDYITPSFFRRRSLFGKVTSVGDGDGFHLFHTPGGRLAGWGWLRRVPKDRKELKGRTISIRIAGVDAPEGAHFGRPAQPFAAEALSFLESYVLGRRVRAYLYKRDQYDRVVATVYVRRPPFFFPRRDVGLEMLRRGLAVTYEGKTGAEFGGAKVEARYREAEALAKKRGKGLWGGSGGGEGAAEKKALSGFFSSIGRKSEQAQQQPAVIESPMAYKKRMKMLDEQKGKR